MTLHLDLKENGYDIIIERGVIKRAGELLKLDRRVLIVTDDGVPAEYAKAVAAQCKHPVTVTVPQGEGSKSLSSFELLCRRLLEEGFTRTDCVVAVGGGVVGDLAGFVASSYMRGIDFYNLPTTFLSQVDSSIGGKVAIDFCGVKNIVGAFYQPKRVLIDPNVLNTLPARQLSSGVAESIKMSLTSDAELFAMFEDGRAENDLDTVIARSLCIKRAVVEQDERESGLRKILNFGHTLGHGIESEAELDGLYHGECVALGMLPMCSEKVRKRLLAVLTRWNLPTRIEGDLDRMLDIAAHDKKCDGGEVSVIWVEEVGACEIRKMPVSEFGALVRAYVQA